MFFEACVLPREQERALSGYCFPSIRSTQAALQTLVGSVLVPSFFILPLELWQICCSHYSLQGCGSCSTCGISDKQRLDLYCRFKGYQSSLWTSQSECLWQSSWWSRAVWICSFMIVYPCKVNSSEMVNSCRKPSLPLVPKTVQPALQHACTYVFIN